MQKLAIFVHGMVCLELCCAGLLPAQEFKPPNTVRSPEKAPEDPPLIADLLTNMDSLDNSRFLNVDDSVSIRIVEDKRVALLCTVSPRGEINAPYVGLIKSTGLTSKELAFKLKARLEEKLFPAVSVMVAVEKLAANKIKEDCTLEFVVAFGAVAKAGKYDFPANEDLTISSLLRRAGGHTSKQKAPKIQIYRKTPHGVKRILVNTQAALNENRSEYDLFLRIDDIVIVEG